MIRQQKMAMSNPDAPTPSVEALLHTIIPIDWIKKMHPAKLMWPFQTLG